MAVQFINVEIFFLLRKFIGPKNPLLTARIPYFVFLRRSAKKMAAKFKGRAKSYNVNPSKVDRLSSYLFNAYIGQLQAE